MINKKNKNFEISNYNEFVEKLNESLNEQTIIPRADSNMAIGDVVAISSFLAGEQKKLHLTVIPHVTSDKKILIKPYYLLLTNKRDESSERWDDPNWEPEFMLYGNDDPIFDYTAIGGPYSSPEQAEEDLKYKNESNADGKQWDKSSVKVGTRHYKSNGQEELIEVEVNDIIDMLNFNLKYNTGDGGLLEEITNVIENIDLEKIMSEIDQETKDEMEREEDVF